MARKVSKREGVLLGVLVAAVLGYMWYTSSPPAAAKRAAETAAKKKADPPAKAPVVRMDLLAARAEDYDSDGRDLFKYSARPPSAEEVRRLRAEAERRQQELKEQQKRAAEEAERQRVEAEARARENALHPQPPPPPTPPVITFRYLGCLGPKDDRIVVFEDGKDLLMAKKGEVVKSQFKVLDVKYQSVVMGFVKKEFKGQTRELSMASK